jgi:hypothetical protein
MAIAWPASLFPSEMTWGIVNNSRSFTSTLSNAQQIAGYPGAYWQCTLTFGLLTRLQERELSAFLGRLDGMFGTFNLPARALRQHRGAGGGDWKCAGAQHAGIWRNT